MWLRHPQLDCFPEVHTVRKMIALHNYNPLVRLVRNLLDENSLYSCSLVVYSGVLFWSYRLPNISPFSGTFRRWCKTRSTATYRPRANLHVEACLALPLETWRYPPSVVFERAPPTCSRRCLRKPLGGQVEVRHKRVRQGVPSREDFRRQRRTLQPERRPAPGRELRFSPSVRVRKCSVANDGGVVVGLLGSSAPLQC